MRAVAAVWMAAAWAASAAAQPVFVNGFEAPFEVAFARAGGTAPLGRGSNLALAWSVPAAQQCMASHDGPAQTSFAGARVTSEGMELVSLPIAGEYMFTLTCSSAAGTASGQVAVSVLAPAPGAPGVTLQHVGTQFEVGQTSLLNYTSAAAAACEFSESGASSTLWTAQTPRTGGQTEAGATRPGVHAYTFTCSNASGSASITRHLEYLPQPGCSDPGLMPAGWRASERSWNATFAPPDGSPFPFWPNSPGFPVPIGAPVGAFRSVPFDAVLPPPGTAVVLLYWDRAFALPNEGYPTAMPASGMFVAISRCRGDVRPAVAGMPADPFLSARCRRYSNADAIFLAVSTITTFESCPLERGERYYLTLMAANPNDGLTPGETSCEVPALGQCHVSSRQLQQ